MVEVFKTNVETDEQAARLAHLILGSFPHYAVNFDLEDCDKILRIKSTAGSVKISDIIQLVKLENMHAEVLPDVIPAALVLEILPG